MGDSNDASTDLTGFVQNLLQQMQSRFQQMSDNIMSRIDEMGTRIDDLEKSITDMVDQAGAPPVSKAATIEG
jgi:heat shock factor-binding protein 1